MGDPFSLTGCLLCDEVTNTRPLSVRMGSCAHPRERILLESASFLLLRDISPLVPGHCLLIPKAHHCSFAAVPGPLASEIASFRTRCVELIGARHGTPLQFEHGASPSDPYTGACIAHAHIHLLPLRAPVEAWLRLYGEVDVVSGDGSEPWPAVTTNQAYFALRTQDGRCAVLTQFETKPPRQFIRRYIGAHLGLASWNWKAAPLTFA